MHPRAGRRNTVVRGDRRLARREELSSVGPSKFMLRANAKRYAESFVPKTRGMEQKFSMAGCPSFLFSWRQSFHLRIYPCMRVCTMRRMEFTAMNVRQGANNIGTTCIHEGASDECGISNSINTRRHNGSTVRAPRKEHCYFEVLLHSLIVRPDRQALEAATDWPAAKPTASSLA